jgi:hypothetical protein
MFQVVAFLVGLAGIIYGIAEIFSGADLASILVPIAGGVVFLGLATRG